MSGLERTPETLWLRGLVAYCVLFRSSGPPLIDIRTASLQPRFSVCGKRNFGAETKAQKWRRQANVVFAENETDQRTPPLAGTSTQAPNKQTDFRTPSKLNVCQDDVMAADEN